MPTSDQLNPTYVACVGFDEILAHGFPTDGEVIARSGGKWIFKALPSYDLAGDTDVVITSPADGDVLTYDGASTKWKNKAPSGGGGNAGFNSLLNFRRTTLVVADGVNLIGADPSYSVGDIWTKVRSDNLTNFFDASSAPFMAASSFVGNNFGDQSGIYSKKNYATGKNIHALGISALARITNVDFWFVIATAVGPAYGSKGFAPDGNPSATVPFAAFRFSTSQGDTHYQAMSCDGSAITTVDTGVTPTTDPVKLLIIFDDATPQIFFCINDVNVATISTHLPPANTGMAVEFSAAEPSSFANPILYISQIAVQSDY